MSKLRIAVLFGGASSEYEVSLLSAASVLRNIPEEQYDVIKIGITKEGAWYLYSGPIQLIENNTWQTNRYLTPAVISPDRKSPGILHFTGRDGYEHCELLNIDCAFPVLHGKNGEDGTIQGLLEMSGIPYVGCGVQASANCMDKTITHTLLDAAGIPGAKWRKAFVSDLNRLEELEPEWSQYLGYPMFVKPANAGSSVGVTKVKGLKELRAALELAFTIDEKAIIEEAVDGIEVETAVLGNSNPQAAAVGEIVPTQEFYSYTAKYSDESTDLYIPARISEEDTQKIRETAVKAYQVLGCSGMARVDFFVKRDGSGIILNEPNTIPGFTSISMYPKLWEYSGLPYPELIHRLIQLAVEKKRG
jgi:D-alanine--D-alanine ligase